MVSIDAIINRQLLKWELERKTLEAEQTQRPLPPRIVTISRQTGSRGSYFATRLAQAMDYVCLHRQVIDEICLSSGYCKRIIGSLDDRFRSSLELMVESVLTGQSVDHSDYTRALFKIVLSMSRLGGVILVGRGGNFILGADRGFHIRFIAPREKRIENLVKYNGCSIDQAAARIDKSDAERKEFATKLFQADINDPSHYDLVINSAFIDIEELVTTAVEAICGKFSKLTYPNHDQ